MGFFNDPSISQIEFLVRSDISSSKKSKTCGSSKPGRWRNGGAFVFCAGDCPFKSEPTHTSADACEKVTGCDASYQEVGRCRTRGGSQRMYIAFTSAKANKAEPILTLKPRGDITRNPRHRY